MGLCHRRRLLCPAKKTLRSHLAAFRLNMRSCPPLDCGQMDLPFGVMHPGVLLRMGRCFFLSGTMPWQDFSALSFSFQ